MPVINCETGETREFTPEEQAAIEALLSVPAPLPPEIPMHKARKALKRMGPAGEVTPEQYEAGEPSWWSIMMGIVETLPARQRDEILDELNTAPNLVLAGNSTTMIKMAMAMSDEQLEAVARLALTLP